MTMLKIHHSLCNWYSACFTSYAET